MHKALFLILLFCLSPPAAARMYQWVDPETGTTQLSGKPPVWYRSAREGPRVFVFEKGRVVDDTGIEVTGGERERLRQRALIQAEQDREQARQKLMESERLKAMVDRERQAMERATEQTPEEFDSEPEQVEEPPEEETTAQQQEETEEAMRDLVREWERSRTQDAREVIEESGRGPTTLPSRGSTPGPPPEAQ